MIDDKYLELIHGEIDGVNSAKESKQLRSYLDAHPMARQMYDELRATSALLQEVKAVEPPVHLQHSIMSALPRLRPAPVRRNFMTTAREWWSEKFEIKYAFAFAGGLAAGVLLFALLRPLSLQNPVDLSKLYGTIGVPQAGENRGEEKRLEIQQPQVTGTIILQNSAELLQAVVVLTSPQSVDLLVSFDQQSLAFKSFTRGAVAAAPAEIAVQTGSVRLTHSGAQNYSIIFEKKAATSLQMNFQVHRAGKLLYEYKIGF